MTYKLAFNESALKEWKKLGHTLQVQFKKKLKERLENPRVPASQLHGRKAVSYTHLPGNLRADDRRRRSGHHPAFPGQDDGYSAEYAAQPRLRSRSGPDGA